MKVSPQRNFSVATPLESGRRWKEAEVRTPNVPVMTEASGRPGAEKKYRSEPARMLPGKPKRLRFYLEVRVSLRSSLAFATLITD